MKNFKIKPLTKSQILISIDRLTRFKNPQIKYLRVFSDIIIHNLLYPQFKKNELQDMPREKLRNIAEYIFNESLEMLGKKSDSDYTINNKLLEYEKSVYEITKETEILLNNKINYKSCLEFIDENSPKNLQWFKTLSSNNDLINARHKKNLTYPIELLILAEGATEEILLPKFCKIFGYDFEKEGIYLHSSGGKNQVVKSYYEFAPMLKIPILVILDSDGEENAKEIQPKLRQTDSIYLLKCGEFEDLYSIELIKRTLFNEFNNISQFEQDIFKNDLQNTHLLEEIFKNRGMHEFKKVEFAQMISRNVLSKNEISSEISEIIEKIKKLK